MRVRDTVDVEALAATSLELVISLQDPSGAYPASPTFSAYRGYSWFRDGAFIADAAAAAGATDSARRFFDWCAGVVLSERDRIEHIIGEEAAGRPVAAHEMLPTRFTLDGAIGTDEWWDFQLDGYGTWMWALGVNEARCGGDGREWIDAVSLCVDYLIATWRRPCFDWWEEHPEEVHTSTLGCIAAGLRAAAGMAALDDSRRRAAADAVEEIIAIIRKDGVADGHLTKWIGDTRVDGSLAALFGPIALFGSDDPLCRRTLETIERELVVGDGVHRFLDDRFYGGGRWPLLSCMLGLAWTAAGDRDRARSLLEWAVSTADDDRMLPEQVAGHLYHPGDRQEWIDRWGPVATPLLWSHAMMLRLAVALRTNPER